MIEYLHTEHKDIKLEARISHNLQVLPVDMIV